MSNSTIYPYGQNGELPSSIGVVNDLITGGSDKALAAEQGKILNEQINGKNELINVELDNIERKYIFINGNNNKWAQATGWYCKFLPVTSGGGGYIITAGNNGVTRYAFMTSNSYTYGSVVTTYATGYQSTIRLEVNESSAELSVPQDASYLYILTEIGSGDTGVSVQVRNITTGIADKVDELYELTDDVQELEVALQRTIYTYEDLNIDEITWENVFINGTTNKWEVGTAGWYSRFVPITSGNKYVVTAGSAVTKYAFLTSNSYTNNTIVSTYATGWSNTARLERGLTSDVLTAPNNASYLYVLSSIGDGIDTGVSAQMVSTSVSLINVDEELNLLKEEIYDVAEPIIVNENATSSDGVYSTLSDAIASVEDGVLTEIKIQGELHIASTVTIPQTKKVIISDGVLRGSVQSIGVCRNDSNCVAKVYIGSLKPQWIMVDGEIKYPASSLRDYPYKANVVSSGSSNSTVTVNITIPIEDASKISAYGIEDVWITLLTEWMSPKLRIDSIDTSNGVITCTFSQGIGSYHNWSGTKRIIIENINVDSITINDGSNTWNEGTFYYTDGYLYYKYNTSASAPTIEIPSVETLITAMGELKMRNVSVTTTAHDFDNLMGEGIGHGYRSFQSGFVINGAIELFGSAEISNCNFCCTTNNAIRVNNSSSNVTIVNCDFNEIGCDAVLVGVTDYIRYNKGLSGSYVPSSVPSNVTIVGNSVHHSGRIYQEASAIAVAYASTFYVGNNVISDTYYTGISTGCDWAATSTQLNSGGVIEGNLLKNIGVGACALADGAAIYNLGNESGMEITKNIIMSVFGGRKGAQNMYAMFFDQGSKNITFSNNLVYDVYSFTSINISGAGSGISVTNNIFALPKYAVTDYNENLASCFTKNIFAWEDSSTGNTQTTTGTYVGNLYYRYDGGLSSISFDTSAVIGNPNFRDKDNYDFEITDTTYTSQISFIPFTLKTPSVSLVARTSNNIEDEEYLQSWILRWINGTL